MFEDYLEDAHSFAIQAQNCSNEREAKRYYRASVFYVVSAIEAFVNYIGNTFAQANVFQPYEIAFLTDRKFDVSGGDFAILEQMEYHRLEDKLRFLASKFITNFDFSGNPAWSQCLEFKKFRDSLVHPREAEDNIDITEYVNKLKTGLSSTIMIMNYLCNGVFGRNLRKKITELTL